jgi:tellurium resistance protein TerD
MGFNLSKGSSFNLSKAAPGLEIAGVGLGWDANEVAGGPIFDLDVSAFLLGSNGQIAEMGDLIFYGSDIKTTYGEETEERPYSPDGSVLGAIDELEGGDDDDDGDEEDMRIYFDRVSDHIKEILVVVTITKYPNDEKKDKRTLDLNFGEVKGCYIRVWDESTESELCRFTLSEEFGNEDAVEFGKFHRTNSGEWEFSAIGTGYEGGLPNLISKYAKNF